VEFHLAEPSEVQAGGVRLAGRAGLWLAVPVEYKRGRPKSDHSDEVQLCAQAMCLEEMAGTAIGRGYLYYGAARRRHLVEFGAALRDRTERLAARLHELDRAGRTPAPEYGRKCAKCSLERLCLPKQLEKPRSLARYFAAARREAEP
jgi:CRISPR-associated exonuclease Cas4